MSDRRIPIPTFKEFVDNNNRYRNTVGKEKQPVLLLGIYYPFVVIGILLFLLTIYILVASIIRGSRYSYRNSPKYKKVIKEGLFWDSVEYHER